MRLYIQLFILAHAHEYLFYFMDCDPILPLFIVVQIVLAVAIQSSAPFQHIPSYF